MLMRYSYQRVGIHRLCITHSGFWNFVVYSDEGANEDVNGKDYYLDPDK